MRNPFSVGMVQPRSDVSRNSKCGRWIKFFVNPNEVPKILPLNKIHHHERSPSLLIHFVNGNDVGMT